MVSHCNNKKIPIYKFPTAHSGNVNSKIVIKIAAGLTTTTRVKHYSKRYTNKNTQNKTIELEIIPTEKT